MVVEKGEVVIEVFMVVSSILLEGSWVVSEVANTGHLAETGFPVLSPKLEATLVVVVLFSLLKMSFSDNEVFAEPGVKN